MAYFNENAVQVMHNNALCKSEDLNYSVGMSSFWAAIWIYDQMQIFDS